LAHRCASGRSIEPSRRLPNSARKRAGNGGGTAAVGRANLNGTGANQRFTCLCGLGAALPVTGVALNSSFIYFAGLVGADAGGGAEIAHSGLAGGVGSNHFATDNPIYGVALDENHLYWTERGANRIARTDLDGGFDESLITGADGPTGVAVDGNFIYWGNLNSGTIGRANLDGSGVDENFIATDGRPAGVAVDGLAATCAGRKATVAGAWVVGSVSTTPRAARPPAQRSITCAVRSAPRRAMRCSWPFS